MAVQDRQKGSSCQLRGISSYRRSRAYLLAILGRAGFLLRTYAGPSGHTDAVLAALMWRAAFRCNSAFDAALGKIADAVDKAAVFSCASIQVGIPSASVSFFLFTTHLFLLNLARCCVAIHHAIGILVRTGAGWFLCTIF